MRKGMLLHHLPQWLEQRNVHLCGIERPYSTPQQIGTATKLHVILGAVLASLPTFVEPFEVSPNDMRRELGLKANCKKWVVRTEVQRRLTEANVNDAWQRDRVWPDDAYDAWAVAHAALRINERGTPTEEPA